jgi:hypothetical protein
MSRRHPHTVTYWAPDGYDEHGRPAFAAPVQIAGRWEDVSEMTRGPDGALVLVTSRVLTADDVAVQGYLYLGTSTDADPRAVDGARQIVNFEGVWNIAGTKKDRTARLM